MGSWEAFRLQYADPGTHQVSGRRASCVPSVWWSSAFLCRSGVLQVMSWMTFMETKTKLDINSSGNVAATNIQRQ